MVQHGQSAPRSAAVWFPGLILLVVGLILLAVGGWVLREELAFHRHGQVAQGQIIEKWTRPDGEGDDHYLAYRFQTADGQIVTGSTSVSLQYWEGVFVGMLVPVQYLPDRPGTNRLFGQESWILVAFIAVVVAIEGGIGLGLLMPAWLRRRRERFLVQYGADTAGTVTSVRKAGLEINDEVFWRVTYRYRDGRGDEYNGASGYLPAAEAARWQVGQTGLVRYNPDKPSISMWMNQPFQQADRLA